MSSAYFKRNINLLVTPVYQFVLIIITFVLLFTIGYHSLARFRNYDAAPRLTVITNEQDKIMVETGLYINNFLQFDIVNNKFALDGFLWFKFDPNEIALSELQKCTFSKGQWGGINRLAEHIPLLTMDGKRQVARFDIKLDFISNLNYRMFPFDCHKLYLTLNNRELPAKLSHKLLFKVHPKAFVVSDLIHTSGWNLLNIGSKSGVVAENLNGNDLALGVATPRVVFELDFVNSSFKDILLLIFPLFVILFMGMLTLYLTSFESEAFKTRALLLASSAMSALIGYRFVIMSYTPKADYFMLIDHIFNLILALLFVIFVLNFVYLFREPVRRGEIILAFHGILIVSWCYFLYGWSG